MNRKNKIIIRVVFVLVLVVCWTWRYISLNQFYDGISDVESAVFQMGQSVPFEDDRIGGYSQAEGYFICVDSFRIEEYEAYVESNDISFERPFAAPEKIALVSVTLSNSTSEAEGVMLIDLQLHGIDNYVGMDWEMLYALNPILEGNPGIRLPHNTEVQLVLPFDLYRNYFGSFTWNNLSDYEWFLRVTAWPTEKDIRVQ